MESFFFTPLKKEHSHNRDNCLKSGGEAVTAISDGGAKAIKGD